MSVYSEEDSIIRFSVLKKERPKKERNFINFRNRNDSNYKIEYENESIKLIELNASSFIININDRTQVVDLNSSPKTVLNALICIEAENFTKENTNTFRTFVKSFVKFHYNPSYIEEIEKSGKNVRERIENFEDSKADFINLTETIIDFKENLVKDLNSTSNPKKIKRLNALKEKLNPFDYSGRFLD
jgi:hypothetical protein